jgi:hypothetical protein
MASSVIHQILDSGINCTASNLDGTKKIASASIISYGAF